MINKKVTKKAFSIIELLVALGIFAVMFTSLGLLIVNTIRTQDNISFRTKASAYIQEIIHGIIVNKSFDWSSIIENSDGLPKQIAYADGRYIISDGIQEKDGIEISFTIENATRDAQGNIVTSGGTEDLHSHKITLTGTWSDLLGIENDVSFSVFVNDWNLLRWEELATADFSDGTFEETFVDSTTGDGSVVLDSVVYADWCHPENSQTAFDLPGSAVARTIRAIPGRVHIGTSGTTPSYYNYSVTDAVPPGLTNNGSFNGYTVNAVFGDDSYAYLATTNDSKEVVILSTATTPYTEVGTVNASGTTDAADVYVEGNRGYLIQGNQLRIFDLTSKTGVRPILGSFTLPDNALHVYARGNYAYVLMTSLAVRELEIINVTNPAAMFESGWADVNILTTPNDLYINEAGTRAFIGMSNSFFQREMYLVDISSKNGARPTISSYDTNGMSIRDLITIPDNTKLILTGSGGEEYQVVDITNESSLTRCGGMQINSGVYGVAAVIYQSGNAYSYVVTSDTSSELKVIRGGEGGGGGVGGVGYPDNGTYISNVFDTGSLGSRLLYLESESSTIPSGTSLQLQIRSGATSDLSSQSWYGPDGTSNSYFNLTSQQVIPLVGSGHRYVQYRALFTSDTISTPRLEDIIVYYQEGYE